MSDADHNVAVEPLSERRWDSIRSEIFARLDGGRELHSMPPPARPGARPAALAGGALLVVGLAAVLVVTLGRTPAPTSLSGRSTRVSSGESSVRTRIGEVSVTLEPASDLTAVGGDSEGWLVVLERGSAEFEVPPRRERPAFIVLAGHLRVEVVGTRFTVRRGEPVSVEVDSGVVRVVEGDEVHDLPAGERWPSAVARAETTADPSRARALDLAVAPIPGGDAEATAAPVEPILRARRVERAPTGRDTHSAGEPGEPSGTAGLEPAPMAATDVLSVEPAATGTSAAAGPESLGVSTVVEAPMTTAPETTADAPLVDGPLIVEPIADPPPAPAAPSARERFAHAAALEASEPALALALYAELERAGGPWAATALYARARLLVERGRRADADVALARYLALYPAGPNADDVRALLGPE